jgi:hypothetical protein
VRQPKGPAILADDCGFVFIIAGCYSDNLSAMPSAPLMDQLAARRATYRRRSRWAAAIGMVAWSIFGLASYADYVPGKKDGPFGGLVPLVCYIGVFAGFGVNWFWGRTKAFTAGSSPKPTCSFCGRGEPAIKKIMAGPGVYICDSCVHTCQTIVDRDGKPPLL